MRVVIISEADEFYLPICLDRFLEQNEHEILGVYLARDPLSTGLLDSAKRFWKIFGPYPVLKHGMRLAYAKLADKVPFLNFTDRYFSMQRVCEKWGLSCEPIHSVNSKSFRNELESADVDLILSISPTQIFKKPLIETPKFGCINIHSAALPKYRGLYPTYWAMACGEKETAVSVHYIDEGLDTGPIIGQQRVEIPAGCTMDYMLRKNKEVAADLLNEAVQLIAEDKVTPRLPEGEGSYFSWPTKESYREFRSLGYRLW